MEAFRHTINASEDLLYYHTSARSADFPTVPIPKCFNELFRQFAVLSLLRHPIAIIRSTGILTCCPSATPFGLALGPTNPTPINVAWETLGFRCECFSHSFKLLMPTFSLPAAPPILADRLQRRQERSSTATINCRPHLRLNL